MTKQFKYNYLTKEEEKELKRSEDLKRIAFHNAHREKEEDNISVYTFVMRKK